MCLDFFNCKKMSSTEPKTCASCKQQIEKGQIITALDQTWHPEHFVCTECKDPITSNFSTEDNKPYCDDCHTKLFAKICHACDEPIKDKCLQAMGVHWHDDHFVCGDCKLKLIGTKFMEVGGKPFCQKCYLEKHADRCKKCSKPIADKAIIALDAKWHQMCFRCSKCEKPIMKDQSYQVDNGLPHCVKC